MDQDKRFIFFFSHIILMQSLVGKHFEGTPKEVSRQLSLIACKHNLAVAVKRSSKELKIDIICTLYSDRKYPFSQYKCLNMQTINKKESFLLLSAKA